MRSVDLVGLSTECCHILLFRVCERQAKCPRTKVLPCWPNGFFGLVCLKTIPCLTWLCGLAGKGGKNRRRGMCLCLDIALLPSPPCSVGRDEFLTCCAGKNESEEKRELIFKEDGQGVAGKCCYDLWHAAFNAFLLEHLLVCRVCSGLAHARQWTLRSYVHRRNKTALSYQRQNAEEGLGQYGKCACFLPCMQL